MRKLDRKDPKYNKGGKNQEHKQTCTFLGRNHHGKDPNAVASKIDSQTMGRREREEGMKCVHCTLPHVPKARVVMHRSRQKSLVTKEGWVGCTRLYLFLESRKRSPCHGHFYYHKGPRQHMGRGMATTSQNDQKEFDASQKAPWDIIVICKWPVMTPPHPFSREEPMLACNTIRPRHAQYVPHHARHVPRHSSSLLTPHFPFPFHPSLNDSQLPPVWK